MERGGGQDGWVGMYRKIYIGNYGQVGMGRGEGR